MSEQAKPRDGIIAIEEHYLDDEMKRAWEGKIEVGSPDVVARLHDLFDTRIREMNESGIDMQILSLAPPATQRLPPDTAVAAARAANDRLKVIVNRHPNRFGAFATLPTSDPAAAADELARSVNDIGFKGAMIHGLSYGQKFVDLPEFWPIFARAEQLDVPIYIHPAFPHPVVVEAYLQDYVKDFPVITKAAWGFTIEAATQAIRLILSGVFQKHPNLKIILGHMGEGLPFLLTRIHDSLSRFGNKPHGFRDIFCNNFYVTTSGNFSNSALRCTIDEMGIERIIFSVDYPWAENKTAVDWMTATNLNADDKAKVFGGNARKLLKL